MPNLEQPDPPRTVVPAPVGRTPDLAQRLVVTGEAQVINLFVAPGKPAGGSGSTLWPTRR